MFQRQIIFNQDVHAFYHVPSLVVAPDGSVLAFCEERWRSPCDDTGECHIAMKKSLDTGKTWGQLIYLKHQKGAKYHMGSAASVPATGKVLLMCDGGWLESMDHGETWTDWRPMINTPEGTSRSRTHGSAPRCHCAIWEKPRSSFMAGPYNRFTDGTMTYPSRTARQNVTAWYFSATIMVRPSTVPTLFCRGPGKAAWPSDWMGIYILMPGPILMMASATQPSAMTADLISLKVYRMATCEKCGRGAVPVWCAIPPSGAAGVTSFCSPIRTVPENIVNMAWSMSVLMVEKAGH